MTRENLLLNIISISALRKSTENPLSIKAMMEEWKITEAEFKSAMAKWNNRPGEYTLPADDRKKIQMFAYLVAVFSAEKSLETQILEKLEEIRAGVNIPKPSVITLFLELNGTKSSIKEKAAYIEKKIRSYPVHTGSGENPSAAYPKKQKSRLYIANQVTYEGFDELQRLFMAYQFKTHTALDGPPGVGKTQSLMEIARLLKKKLYTKTCSSKTTESHIISFPMLMEKNGVSVTQQVNGPLTRAMEEGGIFYGDEFNLLKEDVQKRLNSAFDDRSSIDRIDGVEIQAHEDFWGVISYNPTDNLSSLDLEDSVADRFIHLHYSRWSPDFQAYVASLRADSRKGNDENLAREFGLVLQKRSITAGGDFLYEESVASGGVVQKKWMDFFKREPSTEKPDYIYSVYDPSSIWNTMDERKMKNLETLGKSAYQEKELPRILSRFTNLMYSLKTSGESPLLKQIGLEKLEETEDLELLTIHESSARIEIAAMKHYHYLIRKGLNPYLAQSYATRIVIDQLTFGHYKNSRMRDETVYSFVNSIAKSMRLFAVKADYNTRSIVADMLQVKNAAK